MTVYLLHFDRPISQDHTCQHYMGSTEMTVSNRLMQHKKGRGSRLTQVANERGIGYSVVTTWGGGRKQERKLKHQKNSPKLCPICRGGR